jgi:hypothetical protein
VDHLAQIALIAVAACLGAALSYAWSAYRSRQIRHQQQPAPPQTVRVVTGAVNVTRPRPNTVEGLEIQYGAQGLVRSVRVGAMNVEHKELLLTMDSIVWRTLPNAQKQEVLAAARSTWASKMCPSGPDIAYVIVKTEMGEVVGRADPRSVTIL